jgi:predicted Zn-dependent protease
MFAKRAFRIVLIGVVVLLVGVVAYIGYKSWFGGADKLLARAEATYSQAEKAYEAGDMAKAAQRCEEAVIQTNQVMDRVQVEGKNLDMTSTAAVERLRRIEGQAFWIRARALRDGVYAKAALEDTPIPDTHDTTTGQKFRLMLRIPDAQTQGEAVGCLREAARRLTQHKEVLNEALRTELLLEPLNWSFIEPIARQLVELDAADARVLYMLARYDFEQPIAERGVYQPTSPDKRSRDRMLKARDFLARAKTAKGYQLWRTLHLEAQIADWLRRQAIKNKKTEEAQQEDALLRSLLLDERTGAVQRAAQGEGLSSSLSKWDFEGVQHTQLMALDLLLEDVREKRADPLRLEQLYDRLLEFAQKMAQDRKDERTAVGEAVELAVGGLTRVEPFISDLSAPQWQKRLAAVQALAKNALDQKVLRFDVYERVGQALARQAYLAARRGDKAKQPLLAEQVMQWVQNGLRLAEETKATLPQVAGLHALAADLRLTLGGKRAEIQPHLQALRAGDARAVAIANLAEGTLYEREGRLDKAREFLEKAAASPVPDSALRAQMILASIYLATGQPERALQSIGQFRGVYDKFEELTPQEQAWIFEFIRTPQDLAYLQIVAHLEAARQRLAQHLRDKPSQPIPPNLVKSNEQAVAQLLRDLPVPSPHNRRARQAMISYLALTNRKDQALPLLAELQRDYPDSLEALQLEVALILQPSRSTGAAAAAVDPAALRQADERIQNFITRFSSNVRARLYWADWLQRTARADQAVAYLEDRANFPGIQDDAYKQVLALAYLRQGERAEAAKLLQHLPQSAAVDVALIASAPSREEQEKQIGQALARHERQGVFRCYDAALHQQRGEFAEAAAAYHQALEYTRVKAFAAAGLQRSLLAMARTEPLKARELAMKMLRDTPSEAALLLPIAYASLLLDELGDPTDSWQKTLSMASALNQWGQLALEDVKRDVVTIPLTRAEFWALANRIDQANREVEQAIAREPQSERALQAAVNLALNSGDLDLLPRAEKHLATLRQLKPDDAGFALLQARLEEVQNRTSDALRSYEKILEKNPKNAFAYSRLVALLSKQDRAGAANWIKKWRAESPDDLAAMQAEVTHLAADGKLAEARQLAERHVKEQTQKLADRLLAQKQPPSMTAAEWEKQRQKQMEDLPWELTARMAQAFIWAKAYEEAETWMKRVLDKRPDAELAQMILGDIHYARGNWQQARDAYAKVLAQDKDNGIAANNLAYILVAKLDQPAEAYQVIQGFCLGRHSQKKISGDRLRPEFLDTLGVIYQKLGKPELYPEMRDLFESARKRYPNDPRVYLYLGNAHASLKEPSKAKEMLSTAIALAGSPTKTSLSQSEREEVLQAARAALQKLP